MLVSIDAHCSKACTAYQQLVIQCLLTSDAMLHDLCQSAMCLQVLELCTIERQNRRAIVVNMTLKLTCGL
jgi:hypothetical protein